MSIERFIAIAKSIWFYLDDEEQDNVILYDGTLGFVEHLCEALGYAETLTDDEQVDYIHSQIFGTKTVTPETLKEQIDYLQGDK